MDRRGFLNLLLPAAIVLTDPEELPWKPIRKIFIPPAPKVVCDKLFGADIEFTEDFGREWVRLYTIGVDAEAKLYAEQMADLKFVDGIAWTIETISKAEFRKRYPDARS